MLSRRSLITGLISFAVTAPAIVRASSLMPVKVIKNEFEFIPVVIRYPAKCFYFINGGGELIRFSGDNIEWL